MANHDNLLHFLNTCGKIVKKHKSEIANNIADTLVGSLIMQHEQAPTIAPACPNLNELLRIKQNNLINLLANCIHHLNWREAGFGKISTEISNRICVTELIGPAGFFKHSNIRIGLLLQEPGTIYPRHQHAAEELYFILSGNAHWGVDDKALKPKPPKSFVHHNSNQSHCITTGEEPLLALWGWTGDIDGSSYSI
jgi:dimethylpropiothetin dethiomethylase